jgi:predicted RNA binding protein YcfA (HicA-like mRNA interferase family)
MKIPRDLSAQKLIKLLGRFEYFETRQSGSHIRLTRKDTKENHITIPNHNPIKIGTLNNILNELSIQLNIPKKELTDKLFT